MQPTEACRCAHQSLPESAPRPDALSSQHHEAVDSKVLCRTACLPNRCVQPSLSLGRGWPSRLALPAGTQRVAREIGLSAKPVCNECTCTYRRRKGADLTAGNPRPSVYHVDETCRPIASTEPYPDPDGPYRISWAATSRGLPRHVPTPCQVHGALPRPGNDGSRLGACDRQAPPLLLDSLAFGQPPVMSGHLVARPTSASLQHSPPRFAHLQPNRRRGQRPRLGSDCRIVHTGATLEYCIRRKWRGVDETELHV